MSILIKGMEMPPKGKSICIEIFGEGGVHEFGHCYPCALAYELPTPHGRLIDADKLIKAMFTASDGTIMRDTNIDGWPFEMRYKDIKRYIKNAPTIVEAEGGNAGGN